MNPETSTQLSDIELPPTPPDSILPYAATGALLGVMIVIAVIILWRRHRSWRGRALRRLDTIERDFHAGQSDARHAAFLIAAALRIGLRAPQLAATDDVRWQSLLASLSTARYAPDARIATDAIGHWLHEARWFLRAH